VPVKFWRKAKTNKTNETCHTYIFKSFDTSNTISCDIFKPMLENENGFVVVSKLVAYTITKCAMVLHYMLFVSLFVTCIQAFLNFGQQLR
jgi:hypothetical protein